MNNEMNMDEIITEIVNIRDKSSELERQQDELKERRAALEATLMDRMASLGVSSVGSPHGTVTMMKKQKPVITDITLLKQHILNSGDIDLLQSRLGTRHVAEIFDQGEEIPGVGVIEEFSVSIRRK